MILLFPITFPYRIRELTQISVPPHGILLVLSGYIPLTDAEFIWLTAASALAYLALILSIATLCRSKKRRETVNEL